jgi:hypothetical protein
MKHRLFGPRLAGAMLAVLLVPLGTAGQEPAVSPEALGASLTFHASFDKGFDADFAKGDKRIYTAMDNKRAEVKLGMARADVQLAPGTGRYGAALRFNDKVVPTLLFQGDQNVAYRASDWSVTVSFWLRVDPQVELAPGYCDPVLLTDKKWDDAALFVDFTKDEVPRWFRMAAFSDYSAWNPESTPWGDVPMARWPMAVVKEPPFAGDKWTHVAIRLEGANVPGKAWTATLFLDGSPQGDVTGSGPYTWDTAKSVIQLGISYIGSLDDLAVFDRALSPAEIRYIAQSEEGITGLY